jgi:hypothetical protein
MTRPNLARLPPIPVVGVKAAPESNWDQLRSDALKVLQKYQHDADAPSDNKSQPLKLLNEDLGWELSINRPSVSKMGSNKNQSEASLLAINQLYELMRWAKRVETHPDTKHKNDNVGAIHRFYVPMQIGDKLYRVKLTVKEHLGLNGAAEKMVLHALEAVDIDIGSAPPGILQSTDIYSFSAQPTTRRTISIEQLLQGVKLEDGTPLANVIATQKGG